MENQSFLMKPRKVGSDTLLSQIIQMVNDASRVVLRFKTSRHAIGLLCTRSSYRNLILTFVVLGSFWSEPVYCLRFFVNAIAVLIICLPLWRLGLLPQCHNGCVGKAQWRG